MSNYEKQVQTTEQYYDREMRKIERQGARSCPPWFREATFIEKFTTPSPKASTRDN